MRIQNIPYAERLEHLRVFPVSLICLILAIVPFARTCYVVASTGADCISNDDIIFLSLTESMRGGTYQWLNYFQDTFINGHCAAAAQALLFVLGPLVSWNQYVLCALGIGMALLRTHFTTRFLCGSTGERHYWPVLALVSWTIFSFSQISIFTTGIFSVIWQSCLLFTTLGAYLLWRYPDRLSAAAASSVLGILASWNLAIGLPGWLVYFSIILLRGMRKKVRCLIIAAGMAIASLPYVSFVVAGSSQSRKFSEQYVHWFDPTYFVNALGRPFANDIGFKFNPLPASELAGTVGVLAFVALTAVMFASARLRRVLIPSFILCAWSLGVLAIIGVVRPGIAPWYALIAAWFWSGLTAACVLVIAVSVKTDTTRQRRALTIAGPCMALLVVAVWSWQYNRSYSDKQYYLENRTPVSASILRNNDIAPEAFASYVFKLPGLSTVVTGKMLERNQWSVFSRRQTWEMQGDSIFSLSEGFMRGVALSHSLWIRRKDETSADDFRSFKHLNLCVLQDGKASWRVSLPPNARSIVLKTAVALNKRASKTRMDSGWSIALLGKKAPTNNMTFSGTSTRDWQPVQLDISKHRGDDLSISFANPSKIDAVVFEYPVLELRID